MAKTITVNIPARSVTAKGKVWAYPGYTQTFNCDNDGQWTADGEKVLEAEVIDVCRKSADWADIRQAHFPMFGFHN